jgi:hypothetical protein
MPWAACGKNRSLLLQRYVYFFEVALQGLRWILNRGILLWAKTDYFSDGF